MISKWKCLLLMVVLGLTENTVAQSFLESPGNRTFESGVGVIRGWSCEAVEDVVVTIDDKEIRLPLGSHRPDTKNRCENGGDNGFGAVVHWPSFGMGAHSATLKINGVIVAHHRFRVSGVSTDFVKGLSLKHTFQKFPYKDKDVELIWSEAHQNFVISGVGIPPEAPLPKAPAGSIVHTLTIPKGEQTSSIEYTVPFKKGVYRQLIKAYNRRGEAIKICGDFGGGSINGSVLGRGQVCISGNFVTYVRGGEVKQHSFWLPARQIAEEDIRIVIYLR
ncbi:hypothetical protein [Pseudoteredinibacter isoporae]|uniref:Uncharacterized protein n=1 Tax=Pseudoteredinibacter isoporae TaxID=570281 RepID=A0A7X0MX94_9GAMM|nr:hypothetical protein [Pseudoteredinibacter isoporae]MBB6523035.1 hypothetical protein [Pseudoteredinibacter isoporae]NHO88557.1 hypothetical protein [Pseudoteredinibacter isoporae]NIB22752.1 hypothetical protein [Pseudoteredinibacter isoporae]